MGREAVSQMVIKFNKDWVEESIIQAMNELALCILWTEKVPGTRKK